MKHYYIRYPRNFYNEYTLFSVNAGTPSEAELKRRGFERITRKEAERKCREERDRREYNRSFSGHAPLEIESYESLREPW